MLDGTLPSERSPLRGNRFTEPAPTGSTASWPSRPTSSLARSAWGRPPRLGIHRDTLTAAFVQWGLPTLAWRVGWQPSRYLADRAQAEGAFRLAERLGSINAAAQELGTTWPSLHKAFTRHGLGTPARNPRLSGSMPSTLPVSAAVGQPPQP